MCLWKISFWVISILHVSYAAKILGFFPTDTKSHYILYGKLLRELADRGHHVTVLTQYPGKKTLPNLTEIRMDGLSPMLMPTFDEMIEMSEFENQADIIDICVNTCSEVLVHPVVQDLVKRKDFDLFITEVFATDCFLSIGHKLGIPMAGIACSVILPWVNDMVANPDNPSYIVPYFFAMSQKMSFFQRVYNTIMYVVLKMHYMINSRWQSQTIVDQVFENIPPLNDLSKDLSIILANSHSSFSQVRPFMPQIIEVAGMHIPKVIGKLPEELQTYLDGSKNGFVYFCLGSLAPIESMNPKILRDIVDVLGSLKQNVLLKINSTAISNLPPNIKTFSWMPQLEVLCHPNIKLFISHAGMMGLQESIYCGVPMVGIPLFAEQGFNLAIAKERGVAVELKYKDINNNTLSRSINKILDNDSYSINAKHMSNLFKDRPLHPMDSAVFWLEYVIRNNGAPNLRSPSLNLTWYQYLGLDVLAFIIAVVLSIVYLIWFCIQSMLKQLNHKRKNNKKND